MEGVFCDPCPLYIGGVSRPEGMSHGVPLTVPLFWPSCILQSLASALDGSEFAVLAVREVQCDGKAPNIRFLPHVWHHFGYGSQVVYRDKGISQKGERKMSLLMF